MWEKLGNIYSRNHSQLPVVESRNNFWRVYYSDRIEKKSVPKYFDISKASLSILNDSQERIVDLGRRGTFDWAGVMPTSIISNANETYLYYIGWANRIDVPYHNNLGLMVSSDGSQTYRKFSEGPVLSTSHREPGYVGTMYVLKDENSFKGWYLSCREWIEADGKFEPLYDIKYAVSKDGIDWTPTGETCIHLSGEEGGISQASVIKQSNTYHMWFSSRSRLNFRERSDSYRIKHAFSFDGINWTRSPSTKFGLEVSKNGWDSEMVAYPCVVQEDDDLYMFYNGNGFGKTGVGLARWKNFNKETF